MPFMETPTAGGSGAGGRRIRAVVRTLRGFTLRKRRAPVPHAVNRRIAMSRTPDAHAAAAERVDRLLAAVALRGPTRARPRSPRS